MPGTTASRVWAINVPCAKALQTQCMLPQVEPFGRCSVPCICAGNKSNPDHAMIPNINPEAVTATRYRWLRRCCTPTQTTWRLSWSRCWSCASRCSPASGARRAPCSHQPAPEGVASRHVHTLVVIIATREQPGCHRPESWVGISQRGVVICVPPVFARLWLLTSPPLTPFVNPIASIAVGRARSLAPPDQGSTPWSSTHHVAAGRRATSTRCTRACRCWSRSLGSRSRMWSWPPSPRAAPRVSPCWTRLPPRVRPNP